MLTYSRVVKLFKNIIAEFKGCNLFVSMSIGEPSKFQILSHLNNSRRRYKAEILSIRRKTPSNQSIIIYVYNIFF